MNTLLGIGESLPAARRAAGMSQRELAQALGTSQQQVARWEAKAYRSASLARVAQVAEALGVGGPYALIAAEAPGAYLPVATAAGDRAQPPSTCVPVRDLGEIVTRIRAHGAELSRTYHLTRIGVFGSFVSGDQGPASDVDLLVETSDPGGLRFIAAANFAEEILGRKVDVVRPHLIRDRLRDRILSEVVYVWSA